MAEREVNEGWWSVKWPGQDGYEVVEFVRITQGSGVAAWGYRRRETEDPTPLLSRIGDDRRINARPVHIVKDVQQVIEETRDFGTSAIYRGHRRFEWELTPAVFRNTCEGDERSMLNDFRNRAPARFANCPDEQDLCGWLSLAQHYGLPTRLLDWTQSPLVGAYFAAEQHAEDDNAPGAIWALNPKKLNELMVNGGKDSS